jgi:hypothetical protein
VYTWKTKIFPIKLYRNKEEGNLKKRKVVLCFKALLELWEHLSLCEG